jgi:hypothetical protein
MITYDTLLEVFDKPVAYSKVHEKKYPVDVDVRMDEDLYNEDLPDSEQQMVLVVDLLHHKTYTQLTGLGNQFAVYSTVYAIINDLVKSDWVSRGTILSITGASDKQSKMYRTLKKYLLKRGVLEYKLGNYFIK